MSNANYVDNEGYGRIEVQTLDIRKALNFLKPTLATGELFPELNFYLFQLEGDRLIIESNNNVNSLRTSIDPLYTEGNMNILVHPAIADFFNRVNDPTSFITISDGVNLSVLPGTAQGSFSFPTLPAESFSRMSPEDGEEMLINSGNLHDIVDAVEYASANDSSKLSALCIKTGKKKTNFTCTDGRKIHQVSRLDLKSNFPTELLINHKGIGLIKKLTEKGNGPITLKLGKTIVSLQDSKNTLFSRLYDERFPDVSNYLDTTNSKAFAYLSRKQLLEVAERFEILASFSTEKEKTYFHFIKDHGMTVASADRKSFEILSTDFKGDDQIEISLNIAELIKCLKSMKSEEIVIKMVYGKQHAHIEQAALEPDDLQTEIALLLGYGK